MTNLDMHPVGSGTDEALWDAYRRHDKATVTDYLFCRSVVRIGRSRLFSRLAIETSSKKQRARRAHGEVMLINEGARQIALRSSLN